MIQDLQSNLDNRLKTIQKLELRIKDLESTLSATNEKRYKLQDTIGSMEKELQSTKAHINQMADMQTRYATTGMPNNDSINNILKDLDNKRRQLALSNRGYTPEKLHINDNDTKIDEVADNYDNVNNALLKSGNDTYSSIAKRLQEEILKTKRTFSTSYATNLNLEQSQKDVDDINESTNYVTSTTLIHHSSSRRLSPKSFDRNKMLKNKIDEFIERPPSRKNYKFHADYIPLLQQQQHNNQLVRKETYKPLLLNSIKEQQMMDDNDSSWFDTSLNSYSCNANNNSLIRQSIIAQSCKEIRRNIDESLKIIENHQLECTKKKF